MIAILDCKGCRGDGLKTILQELGESVALVNSAHDLVRASSIILPNTDSFGATMTDIRDRCLIGPLINAIERGCGILGISTGMHLLLDVSYEQGQHTGLGVIHGKAMHFDFGSHPAARHFETPHIGWNQVHWMSESPLVAGMHSGEYFYFDHSLHIEPLREQTIYATCNHGIDFSAIVSDRSVFGTQFLPEKSADAGRAVLSNFVRTMVR